MTDERSRGDVGERAIELLRRWLAFECSEEPDEEALGEEFTTLYYETVSLLTEHGLPDPTTVTTTSEETGS